MNPLRLCSRHVSVYCLVGSLTVFLLFAVTLRGTGQEASDGRLTNSSLLNAISTRLRTELAKECESASIVVEDSSLIVRFETQQFAIHDVGKDGRVSEVPRQVEGPKHNGIVIRVTLQQEPSGGGASSEGPYGEYRRLYWYGYVNEFERRDHGGYILLHLSYGMRVNSALLNAVCRIMTEQGDPLYVTAWRTSSRGRGN